MRNLLFGILISSGAYSQPNSIEKQNAILEDVYYWDQYVRKSKNNCSDKDFKYQDSINILIVDNYILRYGFPLNKPLSTNAYYGIYYAIQHADFYRQQLYIDKFKLLADSGLIENKKYAMMYDRILVTTIGKQKYGEQMYHDLSDNHLKYEPFINIDSVQIFRKQLGLDTIDINRKGRLIVK